MFDWDQTRWVLFQSKLSDPGNTVTEFDVRVQFFTFAKPLSTFVALFCSWKINFKIELLCRVVTCVPNPLPSQGEKRPSQNVAIRALGTNYKI